MSNKSKADRPTNKRENPFSTPIRQKPLLTSPLSLDSHTSRSSSNLSTPSRIMLGSNSNEMDHVLYFAKPYSEWKLIKFLKRKKYKQAQQDTNWKDEYKTYEKHINDDVLEQKSANWESLENQKQKSNNKLPFGRTIEDSLQEAIIQIQEKDSYYNHEIFSNIINTNDNDIKMIFSIENINFLNALTMTTMENINTNADNTITNTNTITNISNSNITMSNASTDDIGDKGESVFKKITS
ncbi:20188_t:CDS:2 [Racocetra persica]|uniref:20188_t:CDS:1 n=1 Tax=Racocetra persica TaxID=160502 RepID=A0ACA9NLT2_9GLOM|nr:20188_t:CDS:2 [Racocetra persica]